jgi:hypothetical protein
MYSYNWSYTLEISAIIYSQIFIKCGREMHIGNFIKDLASFHKVIILRWGVFGAYEK